MYVCAGKWGGGGGRVGAGGEVFNRKSYILISNCLVILVDIRWNAAGCDGFEMCLDLV